ncbi:Polyadenylate-binding protein-interacting protein 1 [Armadillidium nasatum]|uniref:Polyadenylate-binding protein-interacting protein 1 n=1 Tax=Armadillidium nasatum TaxID=96803 RepID=A0A5N5TGX0_9CRUS|nr:Polyadenylate-binding protein-interacting protein 1 [Armadillidium nasatum]
MASLFTKLVRKDIMKEVIAVIIEQGIGEPNFRFNGGRLCQHLSKNVTQMFEGTSFRQLLLMRCQEEYSHKDYYLQFEVSRLCGFTLFLSDIYSNVLTKEGHRFEVLRKGLISLLLLLMTYPSDDTLKCVGQVLKGSGRLLDRDDDKSFSDLMDALKDITLTSKVPDNIVSLLLSVIEYRASDWGQIKVSNSLSSPNSKLDNTATVYNKNVSEYEIEENYSSSDSEDDECYELNFEADEMDDEIAEAFEEFISLNE